MARGAGALLAAAALAALAPGARAALGAVKLDNYTLHKFVGIPGATVLVKIDKAFAYGAKEDVFKEICRRGHPVKDFLVGEIPVQDYGDHENEDVRKMFGAKDDEYPMFYVFKGSVEAGTKYEGFPDPAAARPASWDEAEDGPWEPPMKADITVDNLVYWLRRNGVRMPAVGTIPALDELARRFMAEGGREAADLEEARRLASGEHASDPKAAVYVRTMERVLEKGAGYAGAELGRVRRIRAGKVSAEKQSQLADRERVLSVFAEL